MRSTTLVLLLLVLALCAVCRSPYSQKDSVLLRKPRVQKRSEPESEIDFPQGVPEVVSEEAWDEDWDKEDEDDDDSDCDNGNDDDDGSQWHINDKPKVVQTEDPVDYSPHFGLQSNLTPFPQWLVDITGFRDWPGVNPPYVPQSGIDFSDVPHVPIRGLGNCEGIDLSHCSFDCHRCTAFDDITSCPMLSQTFDDGPGPSTMKLIDNIPGKTTFFTQGLNVIRFPDVFRAQFDRGHLLATHTWSHANLAGLRNEEVAAQIQWSIWAMNATAGVVPKYFRPPYGATDSRVRSISRKFGLVNVFWDRDTLDWKVNDKQKTSADVIQDVRLWKQEVPQGILLEHDSTLDVVNVGIEIAKILAESEGVQMTVAECINGPRYQNMA